MSRQTRVLTLCTGIVVLVAGAAWLGIRSLPSPAASASLSREVTSVSERESRLDNVQAQLEGLQQQLETQQRELARLRHDPAVTDGARDKAGESDEKDDESEEEQALLEQARQERRLIELETQFAGEVVDPRWHRTAESQIAVAVEKVSEASEKDSGARAQLQDAECRSNLCRLTLTHRDEVAAERFTQEFPHQLGWRQTHGRVQLVRNVDGSVSTVIYLSREGQSLYGDN